MDFSINIYMNDIKYRKMLLKKFGHYYSKDYTMDLEKCYYCSDNFYCYDHRPAISRLPNMDIKHYLKNNGKFTLIPSCKDCNKYLGNKDFTNVYDCLLYLKERYDKKISKIPIWTEDELKEMSQHLQVLILNNQCKKNYFIYKIENIQKRLFDDDLNYY